MYGVYDGGLSRDDMELVYHPAHRQGREEFGV
jgi:hypothetical protein